MGKTLELYVILRQCSHMIEVQQLLEEKVNRLAALQDLNSASSTALNTYSDRVKCEASDGKLSFL